MDGPMAPLPRGRQKNGCHTRGAVTSRILRNRHREKVVKTNLGDICAPSCRWASGQLLVSQPPSVRLPTTLKTVLALVAISMFGRSLTHTGDLPFMVVRTLLHHGNLDIALNNI